MRVTFITISLSLAWFTITVNGAPPLGLDDTVAVSEGSGTTLTNVLDNDTDPDGDPLSVTEVDSSPADVGTAVAGSNGGLFTINADGTASFNTNGEFESLAVGETTTTDVTYTVSDGQGGTDESTLLVTVIGVNDAPIDDDEATTIDDENAGQTVLTNVLDNASDFDASDTLIVTEVGSSPADVGTAVAGSNGGLFTIDADGTASFDTNGDFVNLKGSQVVTAITYTVSDCCASVTSTYTVTVGIPSAAPSDSAVPSAVPSGAPTVSAVPVPSGAPSDSALPSGAPSLSAVPIASTLSPTWSPTGSSTQRHSNAESNIDPDLGSDGNSYSDSKCCFQGIMCLV